jgi:hypothetical protein
MREMQTAKKFGIVGGYLFFFAFAFWLLFYHLDSHPLWGDEAETALLAKNVMQFGVPRTFDGTNYLILHGTMDETRDHVWIWSPWLQEYLASASFRVFGVNTWAARAPFALAGGCSLVLLAWVAHKIYRSHRVALASILLMGTSEVFLLHARQCRYYTLSVFAEILLVYGIYKLFVRDRQGIALVVLALILQFYSNYVMAAANLPAVFFLTWMLRKQGRFARSNLMAIFGIFFIAILPWLIYAHPWAQGKVAHEELHLNKAWNYLLELHFHFLPLCFLLLPLIGLFGSRRPENMKSFARWEQTLVFLLGSYFAVILFAPGIYLRYLLPLLPVACLLGAVWIFRYVKCSVAIAAIAIQVLSNAFAMGTAYPFRGSQTLCSSLLKYVEGIAGSYTDRFADVSAFFNQQAGPGQTVLSFDPEFPLRFYTPLAVIDARLMGPPEGSLPDWILPVSASGIGRQVRFDLPESLKSHYDDITISVHNSIPADNFPEPEYYQYQNTRAFAPFVIYKLKHQTNNIE